MGVLHRRFEVAATVGVENPPHFRCDLRISVGHRPHIISLLPQPYGFEGLLPLLVHAHALDGTVTERPHPRDTSRHLDPISPPRVHRPWHHYVLIGFYEFVRLETKGLPTAGEV